MCSIVDAVFCPEMIPYLPENNLKSRSRLFEILFKLPETELTVLNYRYQLEPTTDKKTYKEIGEIIGKSPERSRQIELKALRTIRKKLQIVW